MKAVRILDGVCIGSLGAAGYAYAPTGSYRTNFDLNTSLVLLAVSIVAGILRTMIAYQDFKRRGL